MWLFSVYILTTSASNMNPPIPLDVDNTLPGIELWFPSKNGLLYHLNMCAAINACIICVHQWLMITNPHLVTEYIQYDDCKPFQPLQLQCAVNELSNTKYMHEKLTAIVRYWLRYETKNKGIILSFGLRHDVAVNLIIELPTLHL